MALELAKVGCASALRLYGTDLMALPDPQRILCEKVYGTLLSARGPLRQQPSLLSQLTEILDASPGMWLHGGRLWLALVQGLPFIPAPPEMADVAALRYNRVMSYTLCREESILPACENYYTRELRAALRAP